jgi:dTDP-4-amino-4,6-dideoxygalactose transaminase
MNDRPALLGGTPIRPQGPPPWPPPDPAIERALLTTYANNSWGQYCGGNVERLECEIARRWNVEHVLTCGSGTYAVELGLRALGVKAGDEVVMAAYDYPGNFLAVHALGATPVLVDLDPAAWQLSLDRLDEAISPSTRVVLASHLHGGLVAMNRLRAWVRGREIRILEDAAQCPGSSFAGSPAGSRGDVAVLSFGGSKSLSAGRGGALLIREDDAIHQRARLALMRAGNVLCPLSELQAAVLLPQLEALPRRTEQRWDAVRKLTIALAPLPGLRRFATREGDIPGFYKVGWQYDADAFGLPRARLVEAMRAEGIALDAGFRALHAGRAGSRFRAGGALDEATRAHEGVVILHHPVLLEGDAALDEVVAAFEKVHRHAEELRGGPP